MGELEKSKQRLVGGGGGLRVTHTCMYERSLSSWDSAVGSNF